MTDTPPLIDRLRAEADVLTHIISLSDLDASTAVGAHATHKPGCGRVTLENLRDLLVEAGQALSPAAARERLMTDIREVMFSIREAEPVVVDETTPEMAAEGRISLKVRLPPEMAVRHLQTELAAAREENERLRRALLAASEVTANHINDPLDTFLRHIAADLPAVGRVIIDVYDDAPVRAVFKVKAPDDLMPMVRAAGLSRDAYLEYGEYADLEVCIHPDASLSGRILRRDGSDELAPITQEEREEEREAADDSGEDAS